MDFFGRVVIDCSFVCHRPAAEGFRKEGGGRVMESSSRDNNERSASVSGRLLEPKEMLRISNDSG